MLKRKDLTMGTVQHLGRDYRPTPDPVTANEQSNDRGGGDGRNMSPFPEEVLSKEPLPRKYFNKLLLE